MTDTAYENDVEITDEASVEKTATESKSKRPSIPEGYVSPIGFKNELVKTERVPADYRPQLVYAYVKNPGKANPFPVKWTDGVNVFESHEDAGEESRPVVVLDEALAWWDEKSARQEEKQAAKAEEANNPKPAKATSKGKRGKKTDEVVEVDDTEVGNFDEAE
jgi:hypothetical protein